jgi:hypothetical protein
MKPSERSEPNAGRALHTKHRRVASHEQGRGGPLLPRVAPDVRACGPANRACDSNRSTYILPSRGH